MAIIICTISFRFLFSSSFHILSLLCVLNKVYAHEGRKMAETGHHHTVTVGSLIPSSVCSPSTIGLDEKSTLKVTHKHGPCSPHKQDKANIPSHEDILRLDQARVDSIQSKMSNSNAKAKDSVTLPAQSGSIIGSANYIVTVGMGTPKKDLTLVFDTGSDLTWIQCQPCVVACYPQVDPIFNPSKSTTYKNISCNSDRCKSIASGTGNEPGCSGTTCVYGIQYGDGSFTVGFLAKDTITLSSDKLREIEFGCGENNQGLFVGQAGLMGLGPDKLSIVSQTASKYGKIFSYCLPSSSSSAGRLTFGPKSSKSVKYTRLSANPKTKPYYGLDLRGIYVGGKKLSISPSVFTTSGTIIDSGTVITRLPPAAYSALKAAFKKKLSQYPRAPALSILDTCYDFSKYRSVSVPKISFFFRGSVQVRIPAIGLFVASNTSQVCLAIAGNSSPTDLGIYGNTQQLTLQLVYDVAGGKVGFASGGCN
ncbi:Asp domain-containing protein [Cephalotus follicularis]|uniref:Asp domain-containing protein n=1 Tax=Cephalotus follicularis TaxID=3775 RepID=A0A1Q3CBX5_CEPFO|nr:Asp domain-containing protein [Cephalotus follicularis]